MPHNLHHIINEIASSLDQTFPSPDPIVPHMMSLDAFLSEHPCPGITFSNGSCAFRDIKRDAEAKMIVVVAQIDKGKANML
jgi:hypothetical protein